MEVGDYAGRFCVAVQHQPLGWGKVLLMVLQVVKLGKQPHCLKIAKKSLILQQGERSEQRLWQRLFQYPN